jgi:hypothetical protein
MASNGRRFVAYTSDRSVAETAAASPHHEVWESTPGLPYRPFIPGAEAKNMMTKSTKQDKTEILRLEKNAIDALAAWLKVGIYRGGTPEEGTLLDAAVALEAKRSGKSEREVMDGVLAVPSPLEQHRAQASK